MAEIAYFHILLDNHDVVLAEGAPCETLLDADDEFSFDNHDEAPESFAFLSPFAPRISQGERLEEIRTMLKAQALVCA